MSATAGSDANDSRDACVICLSAVTERAITVPCNHYSFDFVCLVSWLQQRSTCPLCKTEVTAVQYDWKSPRDFQTFPIRRTHPTPSGGTSNRSHRRPHYPLLSRSRTMHRPFSSPIADVALRRRREVYRRKLYSFHVGSNSFSGYRDVTTQMIAGCPELQSRARMWIRRELRVFTFLHTDPEGSSSDEATTSSNAEFLLSYILSVLKMVDIKASNGHAEDLLSEFLGRENTRVFLHELNGWLRSPYTKLDEWDRNVQYEESLP